MNYDDVYQTVQSSPHGSSGRGVSYWSKASKCGRLAILDAQHAEERQATEDLDALSVGVYYHALQEVGMRGQAAGEVWDQTDSQVEDKNWQEALRLYRAYQRDWGTPLGRWGASLIGTEVKIPATPRGEAEALRLFGDVTTGRCDAVILVNDVDAVYAETGILLPGPGTYILDHKTAKSRQQNHEWEYRFGLQSVLYLHLYNLENPHDPARGMIFDIIYKHADITKGPQLNKAGDVKRDSSYNAIVASPDPDAEKVIQAMVAAGKYNVDNNVAIPSHCFSGFTPCRHFREGRCRRF